jgi:hypothetical protein
MVQKESTDARAIRGLAAQEAPEGAVELAEWEASEV